MHGAEKRAYLIQFTYDHYCQGFEKAQETVLVYAASEIDAASKIKRSGKYKNPRNFYNKTIE